MTKSKVFIFCLLSLLIAFTSFISGVRAIPVWAEEITYTDALSDLSKDENFNVANYPANETDYSITVIQVAESVNGELFIYTYQPSNGSKDLIATSINISQTEGGLNYNNYELTLLNTSGVFNKYKVEGLIVSDNALRFYYISSIFRAFDETIDEKPTDDNTITFVSSAVGQYWQAYTILDKVHYACEYLDIITVESKHVGFIRYTDLALFTSYASTDSHYIAFSTNRKIDDLLEAEISFAHQSYYKQTNNLIGDNQEKYGNKITEEKLLLKEEVFSKDTWFHKDYSYNRIQTIDEFIANETSLKAETKTALEGTEWVLRFYESGYSTKGYYTTDASSVLQNYRTETNCEIVSDVTILSLKFEYDGAIYTMGVVDNMSQGDSIPDNETKCNCASFCWIWHILSFDFTPACGCIITHCHCGTPLWLYIVMGAVVVAVLAILLLFLFPIIKLLFKLLWWLICLPFRFIAWIFRRK